MSLSFFRSDEEFVSVTSESCHKLFICFSQLVSSYRDEHAGRGYWDIASQIMWYHYIGYGWLQWWPDVASRALWPPASVMSTTDTEVFKNFFWKVCFQSQVWGSHKLIIQWREGSQNNYSFFKHCNYRSNKLFRCGPAAWFGYLVLPPPAEYEGHFFMLYNFLNAQA